MLASFSCTILMSASLQMRQQGGTEVDKKAKIPAKKKKETFVKGTVEPTKKK